jgi:hypothetical protein
MEAKVDPADEKDVQKTEIVDLKEISAATSDKPKPKPEPLATPATPAVPTRVRYQYFST